MKKFQIFDLNELALWNEGKEKFKHFYVRSANSYVELITVLTPTDFAWGYIVIVEDPLYVGPADNPLELFRVESFINVIEAHTLYGTIYIVPHNGIWLNDAFSYAERTLKLNSDALDMLDILMECLTNSVRTK